jgi:5-methylcytosine-specific restriction endonuclease McrA
LTEQNHRELLALARHRTKRDILRLIRRIDPRPDAPATVEPLGPAPVGMPVPNANPSWEDIIAASSPPVQELPPGDNPRDWTTARAPDDDGDLGVPKPGVRADGLSAEANRASAAPGEPSAGEKHRASAEAALPRAPERYKVQFTASEEYVDLLQQAKDLMSHALPGGALEQLHLQAMRLLVAELKKRRCGAPRPAATRQQPRQRGDAQQPRQRGHVAVAVRRAVWPRDGSQCTYVDKQGRRCREAAFLELHHLQPHARGGPDTEENLTLRCRAHNALAAEQDFGRAFMQRSKRGHEAAPQAK